MRVGYTTNQQNVADLERICDKVYFAKEKTLSSKGFVSFVKEHKDHELVVLYPADIGLQLIQLLPGLEELQKQQKHIEFIENIKEKKLPNNVYHQLLLGVARNEKKIMSQRTASGIKEAQSKGIRAGRPQLKKERIAEIEAMGLQQKWSMREIAAKVGVSVGTVYKYVHKSKKVD